jgi:DNA-directed RNA polymerase subunit K/omega
MSKRKSKKVQIKNDSDDELSEFNEITEENIINDDDDYELEEDEEEYEDNEEEEIDVDNIEINNDDYEYNNVISEKEEIILDKENRISSNRLSKYEMVRILGERTKQLTMGGKPLVKNYEGLSYEKIAEEELKLNMIPYIIKRTLPNGKIEKWYLDELYKDHLLLE